MRRWRVVCFNSIGESLIFSEALGSEPSDKFFVPGLNDMWSPEMRLRTSIVPSVTIEKIVPGVS